MCNAYLADPLHRFLGHRYLVVVIILLVVLIYLPSLGRGWWADDLVHRAKLLNSLPFDGKVATMPHPNKLTSTFMDLFFWSNHKAIRNFVDFGSMPWWTFKGGIGSFWRPISALTHWIDYRLWPDSAVLMHVHSLLWYLVVIASIMFVYRRLMMPLWSAGLAMLLFSMDDLHYNTVAWLASRYVLPAFFFGLLSILAHDRWRREGSRIQVFFSYMWLSLALLSAEAGIGTIAYLAAYALFLDEEPWRNRLLSLIPCLTVVTVWRIIYRYLGYGVTDAGLYVDPIVHSQQFVSGMIKRGPILLLSLLGEPAPSKYACLSVTGSYFLWIFAIMFLIIILILLLPLFRQDRVACFWATGMVLCIVPSCASRLPSGRLLLFASLGAMGLVAQVMGGVFDSHNWVPRSRIIRSLIWSLSLLFIILHLGMPTWRNFKRLTKEFYFIDKSERKPWPYLPSNVEGNHLVIINHPNPFSLIYLPFYCTLVGQPLPAHIRTLAPGFSSVDVTRLDEVTLAVKTEDGFLSQPGRSLKNKSSKSPIVSPIYRYQLLNRGLRGPAHPLKLGEALEVPGVKIEVTGLTMDGDVSEATFRFQRRLEDPSMKWFKWDWHSESFISFSLPSIGETKSVVGPFD